MGVKRRFHFLVAALLAVGAALSQGCAPQVNPAAEPTAVAQQSDRVAGSQLTGGTLATYTVAASREPSATSTPAPTPTPLPSVTPTPEPTETATPTSTPTSRATPTPTPDPKEPVVIGTSMAGRPIESYRIGQGPINVVFVGGIHGGYEWNTILLAYEALDHFQSFPEAVPAEVALYIIPNANPDGLYTVTFKTGRFQPSDVFEDTFLGRFNGNGVDLNRNWDCDWQPMALWGDQPVYAGERPFSEPESRALSQFLLGLQPAVVVFLHSAAEGAYAAGCPETDPDSYSLAMVYGLASGYPIFKGFDSYDITGDAGDWLVSQRIPSFTVELTNHQDLDWEQNLAGMLALLAEFAAPAASGLIE